MLNHPVHPSRVFDAHIEKESKVVLTLGLDQFEIMTGGRWMRHNLLVTLLGVYMQVSRVDGISVRVPVWVFALIDGVNHVLMSIIEQGMFTCW